MKTRFALKLSVAAVAMAFAATASASVTFPTANQGSTSAGGVAFASEQNLGTDGKLTLNFGTGANLSATGTVGASLGNDAKVFMRFDLPEGVAFAGTPTLTVADSRIDTVDVEGTPTPTTTTEARNGTVSLGGNNSNFVVFEVSPRVGAQFLQGGAVVFSAAGITVSNKENVSLQMRTFDQLAFAANKEYALADREATQWVRFAPAIAVNNVAAQSHEANVSASTGAYTNFTTIGVKPIVALQVTHTPRALASGYSSTVSNIVADTNSVSVTGDFSWAASVGTSGTSVKLANNSGCTGSVTATVTANGSGATLSGIAAADLVTGDPLYVCAEPNTTAAIPAGSYSGTVTPAAQTGYTVGSGSTGSGEITRNGTVLRAPFMNAFSAGGQFAFVQIQNNSESAAPFTATCYTWSGSTTGNTLEVPASRTRAFSAAQLGCPANTTAADLVFAVPTGRVNAVMVRQNQTTGDAAVDGLVGNSNQ